VPKVLPWPAVLSDQSPYTSKPHEKLSWLSLVLKCIQRKGCRYVKNILGEKDFDQKYLDATDGLAAAVCHFFQGEQVNSDGKTSNWEEFIKKNPKRVRKQ
jgi:hypothetical protein